MSTLRWGMRSKMSRKVVFSLMFSVMACANFAAAGRGEIVDKIVAVVDGRIITLSDVRKQHQIDLVRKYPAQTDEEALNSLVDRYLLEGEMAQYPGSDVTDKEVDDEMNRVTDNHGLSTMDIRAAIIGEIQRRNYLIRRYSQFIVISDEEIETYYNDEFVPEVKQRGDTPPPLSQVAMDIRQNLMVEKLKKELDDSLKELRSRSTTSIEIIQ